MKKQPAIKLWRGWAWKWHKSKQTEDVSFDTYKPCWEPLDGDAGSWVRVKFIEVMSGRKASSRP